MLQMLLEPLAAPREPLLQRVELRCCGHDHCRPPMYSTRMRVRRRNPEDDTTCSPTRFHVELVPNPASS